MIVARDKAFEATVVREMTRGIRVDPEPLIHLAQTRADRFAHDYGRDFPDLTRNLEHEALEEIADAVNYVVWRLDAIRRGVDLAEWKVAHLQIAVRHFALAFEELRATL
jgi:hypothetical protein